MEDTKKNQMEILETKNVKTEKNFTGQQSGSGRKKSPNLKIDQQQ